MYQFIIFQYFHGVMDQFTDCDIERLNFLSRSVLSGQISINFLCLIALQRTMIFNDFIAISIILNSVLSYFSNPLTKFSYSIHIKSS